MSAPGWLSRTVPLPAFLLAGTVIAAAETPDDSAGEPQPPEAAEQSVRDRIRALQEYRDTLYPDFIISADLYEEAEAVEAGEPEPTVPLVFDDEGEETLVLEDPEIELVEIPSIADLGESLASAIEEIRMAILAGLPEQDVEEQRGEVLALLGTMVDVMEEEAPNHASTMEHYQTHLGRLTANLVEDYAAGDERQLENTDRLIHQEFAGLEQLLLLVDEQAREDVYMPRLIPEDWVRPEVGEELEEFSRRVRAWRAERLTGEYRDRLRLLDRTLAAQRRTFDDSLVEVAGELYLIGVELSRRDYEVHRLSRQSYVNSALRLELLAEGLRDYLEEENVLYARRHVRIMGRALEQTEGYLALSRTGFEGLQ